MEGKLIKTSIDSYHNGHYFLNDSDGFAIGSTDKDWCKRAVSKRPLYILSLKNCETIENGYDLDELAKEEYKYNPWSVNEMSFRLGFDRGFQKALELLGNKKFSEKDIERAFIQGVYTKTEIHRKKEEYIQSLQQTEWDVEIEMIGPLVYPANLPKEGEERPDYRPKLDENGYLILKRK